LVGAPVAVDAAGVEVGAEVGELRGARVSGHLAQASRAR